MLWIDGWPYDAAISEERSYRSEVTDHPVESGADISDHVHNLPMELTVEGAVSDTPIGEAAAHPSRAADPPAFPIMSDMALTRLEKLRDDRKRIVIESDIRTYDSMVLMSLVTPITRDTEGGLRFTATFKKIRIVENRRATVRVALPRANGQAKLGHLAGKLKNGEIIWRKGRPPGTAQWTVPVGEIYETETIVARGAKVQQVAAGANAGAGYLYHKDGRALDGDELAALALDLDRDNTMQLRRNGADVERLSSSIDDRLKKAQALIDWREAHPGQSVDPSVFGLKRSGN